MNKVEETSKFVVAIKPKNNSELIPVEHWEKVLVRECSDKDHYQNAVTGRLLKKSECTQILTIKNQY